MKSNPPRYAYESAAVTTIGFGGEVVDSTIFVLQNYLPVSFPRS